MQKLPQTLENVAELKSSRGDNKTDGLKENEAEANNKLLNMVTTHNIAGKNDVFDEAEQAQAVALFR
jgi:hypothetical protein